MNVSDEDVPLIIRALEDYADYLTGPQNRDDRSYRALADSLKRKGPGK